VLSSDHAVSQGAEDRNCVQACYDGRLDLVKILCSEVPGSFIKFAFIPVCHIP